MRSQLGLKRVVIEAVLANGPVPLVTSEHVASAAAVSVLREDDDWKIKWLGSTRWVTWLGNAPTAPEDNLTFQNAEQCLAGEVVLSNGARFTQTVMYRTSALAAALPSGSKQVRPGGTQRHA
jgi:hypothetical protein